MYRFFENKDFENTIELSEKNAYHFMRVLRIKEDEIVEICAKNGIFEAKLIQSDAVVLEKVREIESKNESSVKLTLYQAILKGDKMDQALRQATEAGVSEIYPLRLKRVVADIDKKVDTKVQRWQKVVEAAAKQSKRDFIPRVNNPINLDEVDFENMDIIVPYENEENLTLYQIDNISNNVGLIIGPEGGFENSEIEKLREKANIITLGNRILRAETAAVCASFSIIYYLESR